MMLILDPTPLTRGLAGKKVDVVNYPDGRFAVQFNGTALGFRVFDKIETVQPGAIVDNKRLSAVLEQVKAQQAAYAAHQQRGHAARRPLVFRYVTKLSPAKPANQRAETRVGFQGIRRSTPMLLCNPPVAGAGRCRSAPGPSE